MERKQIKTMRKRKKMSAQNLVEYAVLKNTQKHLKVLISYQVLIVQMILLQQKMLLILDFHMIKKLVVKYQKQIHLRLIHCPCNFKHNIHVRIYICLYMYVCYVYVNKFIKKKKEREKNMKTRRIILQFCIYINIFKSLYIL